MNLSQQRVLMVLGLVVAAALATWWVASHHREMVLEHNLPKPLASDPWAASRQFLTSMGMEPQKSTQLDEILDKANSRSVVILDIAGRAPDESQLRRLFNWVRGGGRLVVEIDRGGTLTNCLLPSWGLRLSDSTHVSDQEECDEGFAEEWKDAPSRHWASEASESSSLDEDESDEDESEPLETVTGAHSTGPVVDSGISFGRGWRTIRIADPDSSRLVDSLRKPVSSLSQPAYVVASSWMDSLVWSDAPPREAFRDPGGFVLIGRMDRGSIAVVRGFEPFQYDEISKWDHAALLWRIMEPIGDEHEIWFARHARLEGWLSILADRLGLALVLCALALVLSMWAAAARFGPVLVAQSEEKTGIVDHAEGAGRWLWQIPGGRLVLLTALQNSARRTQLRTHPELVGADPKTLGRTLEADGLGNAAALEQAFEPASETSDRHFLTIAKTLWSLRRNR